MANFYFKVDDVFFYLDATTKVTTRYPAELSSSPMQNGTDTSDNYRIKQPVCTMVGKITDIKTPRSPDTRKTGDWIKDFLTKVRNAQSPVFLKNYIDQEETPNWFVTEFTTTQNNTTSSVGFQNSDGEVKQAFDIQIKFNQVILSEGIVSRATVSERYTDSLSTKSKKNMATRQFNDTLAEQSAKDRALEKSKENFDAVLKNLGF